MRKTTKQIISENLQRQLKLTKTSQTKLANAIGVTPATVSAWVKCISAPYAGTIDKICRYFGISKEELLRDQDDLLGGTALSKTVPLYNSYYANIASRNIERLIAVDNSVKADFGIIVSSDSMSEIGICPGDVAFFTKDCRYIEGHIYAVWIMGKDSVILKKVYVQHNNYVLVSENKDIPPIVVENNEALIIGELLALYKEWKWD